MIMSMMMIDDYVHDDDDDDDDDEDEDEMRNSDWTAKINGWSRKAISIIGVKRQSPYAEKQPL